MKNRIIKFRVWKFETKSWVILNGKQIGNNENLVDSVYDDYFSIQQFTGLTDSAGKEIFEGDIFRLGNSIVEVIFENGYFALKHKSGLLMLVFNELDLLSEILGNVFENPELLKK